MFLSILATTVILSVKNGINCNETTLGSDWFLLISLSVVQSVIIAVGAAYMSKNYKKCLRQETFKGGIQSTRSEYLIENKEEEDEDILYSSANLCTEERESTRDIE